ncbi:eRF1 methyltransferase catalytic subunit MTQ2 [Spathaspora sp. JA1]|nr:eRF1 methyltransferase catalytic subunit MTQ2 [Spathaspora sp. JA1]
MLPTPTVKDIDYDKVYEPSEDSFLLLDCFEQEQDFIRKRFKDDDVVPLITEIGSGSGIVSTFFINHILPKSIVLTTDVNPHACQTTLNTCRQNQAESENKTSTLDAAQMNLTDAVRPGSIDLLIFNPPYVPASEVPVIPKDEQDPTWLDLALLGGEDGMVTTWQVLNNLHSILSKDRGVAYILFCARNKPNEVSEIMKKQGWKVDVIISRKAGWEVLSVLRFQK